MSRATARKTEIKGLSSKINTAGWGKGNSIPWKAKQGWVGGAKKTRGADLACELRLTGSQLASTHFPWLCVGLNLLAQEMKCQATHLHEAHI